MGNNGGWDTYNSCELSISIHPKLSAWGANNGNNGETIVEDGAQCEDQSGKDNGNENDDGNMATQSLSIKDCNDHSLSEIMNHAVKVSCTEQLLRG